MPYTSLTLPNVEVDDPRLLQIDRPVERRDFGCGFVPRTHEPPAELCAPVPFAPLSDDEIRALIRERDASGLSNQKLWLDHDMKALNQGSLPHCWAYAAVGNLMMTKLKAEGSTLVFSPDSVACLINNFRPAGGWGMRAMQQMSQTGVCTVDEWPMRAIDRRYWTKENGEKAKTRRVTHFYDLKPQQWQMVKTMLAKGFTLAMGFPWWGHEVLVTGIVLKSDAFVFPFLNSWGEEWGDRGFGLLSEAKARNFNDCCTVVTSLSYPVSL